MPRVVRISVSFVVVLAAYWGYALVAVPLIEPRAGRRQDDDRYQRDRLQARMDIQRRLQELEGLFPPDSWVLENAKILQSDQVRLLIRDYQNLGNGKVEIRPCAMVYTPDGPAETEAERKRQSVVLEAPEGALLQFDQPFELSRGEIGRLVTGRLNGQIVLRSDGKRPGPADDLVVVTRDVEITEEFISTPHEVRFRYGPNHGRGRRMTIKLLPGDRDGGLEQHGPNIAGVEWFELGELEQLHLDFRDQGALPVPSASGAAPSAAMNEPIEISCRGPFRFSPVEQVITLQDRVDVLRLHANGPSDQLNCERLTIRLARSREAVAEPGKTKAAAALDLQPRWVEARGRPVILRAPSQNVDARGERLEYDVARQRIVLENLQGQGEVVLRQEANEIHAVSLEYQAAGPGRLGQVAAQGPGWLRGQMTDRIPEPIGARWKGQLHVRPDQEQRQVISLTGGAELTYGAVGQLQADEIHFWLFEIPAGSRDAEAQLRPDRMLALRQVRLQSAQLSGEIDELGVWFEHPAMAGVSVRRASSPRPLAGEGPGVRAASKSPHLEHHVFNLTSDGRWHAIIPTAWKQPWPGAALAQPAAPPGDEETHRPAERSRHFHVVGRLLRCRILMRDEQPELAELLVRGQVRFEETQTAQPDQPPILVTGDQVHLVDAGQPHASVTVTGTPAHFAGPRIGLTGTNINLNRGTNRLWIDGAGRMDLTVDRDLEGRSLPQPSALQIDWQRKMTFDGHMVHFEEAVVASTPQQQLRTEILDVTLRQTIRFDQFDEKQQVEPEQLLCAGGVVMENQFFDDRGLASREKLHVGDLVAHLISGDLQANGPGWMASVRRQTGSPLSAMTGQPAAPDPAAGSAEEQLIYLNVRFQGRIVGNLQRREMTFHDRVKTTYGPVNTWDETLDPDAPEGPGPQGFLLSCDEMSVFDMPLPSGEGRAIQLEATGNTLVEGSVFTARAARMTYAKEKDLLVLEGDGFTNAELSAQKYVGAPVSTASARKILYWPQAKRLSIDGGRWLELNELPALSARPK